jgi:hypothetical protein
MRGDDAAAETPGPLHHVCPRAPSRGLSQHQATGDSCLPLVIDVAPHPPDLFSVALCQAQMPFRGKHIRGRLHKNLVEVLGQAKHGHTRLCGLRQKRTEKQSCIHRLNAKETRYIPLVKFTPMVLETGHRNLTNRVRTSFTLVGNSADSRGPDLADACDARPDWPLETASGCSAAVGYARGVRLSRVRVKPLTRWLWLRDECGRVACDICTPTLRDRHGVEKPIPCLIQAVEQAVV